MENQGLGSLFSRPKKLAAGLNPRLSYWFDIGESRFFDFAGGIGSGADGPNGKFRLVWMAVIVVGGKSSLRALAYNAPVDLVKI